MENKESFVDLYTRLYNENFNELETLREKEKSKSIKIFLLIIGVMICFSIFPILGIVAFMCFIVYIIKSNLKNVKKGTTIIKTELVNGEIVSHSIFEGEESYKRVFKEKIITPIIQNVIPEANYTPRAGITESEYRQGNWERYDRYRTEDKIEANIYLKDTSNKKIELKIAEVHTENENTDDEGNTMYITVFHGLVGSAKLPKDISCYLRVERNSFNLFGGPKDRLEMDMAEFEKVFDVKTDDRIKAMQILTADIMTELLDLAKTSKIKFEFYINNDIMHIRFHTGEMFEPEVFGKSMQLDKLRKCFDKIETVKNVTEHICQTIEQTEI